MAAGAHLCWVSGGRRQLFFAVDNRYVKLFLPNLIDLGR